MRSGVHPAIVGMILGHGDKKKSLQNLYLTISDQDLINAINRMTFNGAESDHGGIFRRTSQDRMRMIVLSLRPSCTS
jgi:hypothetical protein